MNIAQIGSFALATSFMGVLNACSSGVSTAVLCEEYPKLRVHKNAPIIPLGILDNSTIGSGAWLSAPVAKHTAALRNNPDNRIIFDLRFGCGPHTIRAPDVTFTFCSDKFRGQEIMFSLRIDDDEDKAGLDCGAIGICARELDHASLEAIRYLDLVWPLSEQAFGECIYSCLNTSADDNSYFFIERTDALEHTYIEYSADFLELHRSLITYNGREVFEFIEAELFQRSCSRGGHAFSVDALYRECVLENTCPKGVDYDVY